MYRNPHQKYHYCPIQRCEKSQLEIEFKINENQMEVNYTRKIIQPFGPINSENELPNMESNTHLNILVMTRDEESSRFDE